MKVEINLTVCGCPLTICWKVCPFSVKLPWCLWQLKSPRARASVGELHEGNRGEGPAGLRSARAAGGRGVPALLLSLFNRLNQAHPGHAGSFPLHKVDWFGPESPLQDAFTATPRLGFDWVTSQVLTYNCILTPSSEINRARRWGLISGLSVMFYWSVCPCLCRSHVLLISVALQLVLKLESVSHSTLFLVFSIVLAVLGPLPFYINFKIRLPISERKTTTTTQTKTQFLHFDRNHIGSRDQFGENCQINNIELSSPRTWSRSGSQVFSSLRDEV